MEMSRRCKEKQSSERRVIAGEAKMMIHDRIPTEEVMKLAAIAISLNVRPRSSDMPLHMQERAFRYARSFLDSAPKHRPNPTHLARALKKILSGGSNGTKLVVLPFNTSAELIMQDTSILGAESHPLHLHGLNFFVVGQGFGNFDLNKDPANFNLVDPIDRNTVAVRSGG
ncbi:hypothetical protein GH714_009764 [Hevea brasiliensis]|uniref:Plastocyanin-like domain-containing protein n=1 Tax=Hevea brasiliensis TaxID=3981 RepID=A0A6A6KC95_HEVBR|nr:hypothetical protein GH714_009764 [Hevea brasiliensis]